MAEGIDRPDNNESYYEQSSRRCSSNDDDNTDTRDSQQQHGSSRSTSDGEEGTTTSTSIFPTYKEQMLVFGEGNNNNRLSTNPGTIAGYGVSNYTSTTASRRSINTTNTTSESIPFDADTGCPVDTKPVVDYKHQMRGVVVTARQEQTISSTVGSNRYATTSNNISQRSSNNGTIGTNRYASKLQSFGSSNSPTAQKQNYSLDPFRVGNRLSDGSDTVRTSSTNEINESTIELVGTSSFSQTDINSSSRQIGREDRSVVVAYLVEDDDKRGSLQEEKAPQATREEQQQRNKVKLILSITFVLVLVIIGIGLFFGLKPTSDSNSATAVERRPFLTTIELYQAIDVLMASRNKSVEILQAYGPTVNDWDVSRITDFNRVFDPDRASPFAFWSFNTSVKFNEDISKWNTSSATSMMGMFASQTMFNQDISMWDVSNVRDMAGMFAQTWGFNQNLSKWNTAKVTTISHMFYNSCSFDGDVSGWDTQKVSNMSSTFEMCWSLGSDKLYNNWNTSSVIDMSRMFKGAMNWTSFDVSKWDVSKVINISYMFSNAQKFNADVSRWDVQNVIHMTGTFSNASSFGQDVSSWNVSKVTSISEMFSGTTIFNQNLCSWGTILQQPLNTTNIFNNTSCPNQDRPNFITKSPWCYDCPSSI